MPRQTLSTVFYSNPVCIFSKCLQFLDYDELGEAVAKAGFNSIDLTVRKGGYVEPDNVAKELPKVIKILKRSGINVPMIVTDIKDGNDKFAADVLSVAADLGIQYYRMGYFLYNQDLDIFTDLDNKKFQLESILKLNRKYNLKTGYQNHSGPWGMIGGAIWDLHYILKDFDPEYIGVQYDIAHATVEGGYSWEVGLKIIMPWINSLAVKDFVWEKGKKTWKIKWAPLGEGMVDFKKYSLQVKSLLNTVPITLHYEYDLGGAELGKQKPTMARDEIYKRLANDLRYFENNIKSI